MQTPNPSCRHTDGEAGSITWALLVALAVLAVGSIFTASVITTVQRSKASADATVLTQYTDTATADAIARLNAGQTLPRTLQESIDADDQTCEKVGKRTVCWRYWALPVPGSAIDPIRYDLVSRVWLDHDGDELEPADGFNVRSTKLPLEVITYQTSAGLGPTLQDGYVAYHATPAGLFANAIHSFDSSTFEGPRFTVRSYNSATGDTGTGGAMVSTSGWVSYGASTHADSTVLFGGAAPGGDHTTRCTGEACAESNVRVVDATYAAPTPQSTSWMRTVGAATCTTTHEGDWIASEHARKLPAGVTCIDGSLIIDADTTTSTPLTTLFVNGTISIDASLNAPPVGLLAQPSGLAIYSTGDAVSFDLPADGAISAMLYAPLATCGTSPAATTQVTYFGSLVCDVVSIGGPWDHLYDLAATAQYEDPVPGAAKTYSPGVASNVDFDDFQIPGDWSSNTCVYAPPTGATGYWKLDEPTGPLARDSAGGVGPAGWAGNDTRIDGVCGKGAKVTSGGPAIVGSQPVTPTSGLTIEYWARDLVGTAVQIGGVTVTHDATRHVSVTLGGSTYTWPFSVENYDKWHLYTVRINSAGSAILYVDGVSKKTVATGVAPGSLSGPVSIGQGTRGAVDEVVYYPMVVAAADIANRFSWWTTNPLKIDAAVQLTDAGTPFGTPGGFGDNGTTPTRLRLKWDPVSGTFPSPAGTYRVQFSNNGSSGWSTLESGLSTGTRTWQQNDPPLGTRHYRVCAEYNGDTLCSASESVVVLEPPNAPDVTGKVTSHTRATFTWPAVATADDYYVATRCNSDSWTYHSQTSRSEVITCKSGDIARIAVRARNAAGNSAYTYVNVQLTIPEPSTGSVAAWSERPYLYARLDGVSCPSGTVIQSRGQVRFDGTSWPGFSAWANTGRSNMSLTYRGNTVYYHRSMDASIRVRCHNPDSGYSGPETGSHIVTGVQHTVPLVTGVWISPQPGSRKASWGSNGCGQYLTVNYRYDIETPTFSKTGYDVTSYSRTDMAWGGPGSIRVQAWCEVDADGRASASRTTLTRYWS